MTLTEAAARRMRDSNFNAWRVLMALAAKTLGIQDGPGFSERQLSEVLSAGIRIFMRLQEAGLDREQILFCLTFADIVGANVLPEIILALTGILPRERGYLEDEGLPIRIGEHYVFCTPDMDGDGVSVFVSSVPNGARHYIGGAIDGFPKNSE